MTNIGYLNALLGDWGISSNRLAIALDGAGLPLDAPLVRTQMDAFLYEFAPTLMPSRTSVSELGVSLSYNIDAFRAWYSALCLRLGKPNLLEQAEGKASVVRDASQCW